MALLNFKYGNQSSLPAFAQAEQGTVYVTKDTNRLFIALPEGSDYMNTGDFQLVTFSSGTAAAALAALTSSLKRTNILYVTVDTANNNATAMWRYTGSAFVAISNTAEIDGIKGDISALQTAVSNLNTFKDTTVPATYMPLAGGQFTGDVSFKSGEYLTVNAPRTGDTGKKDAATREYVDTAKSSLLGSSTATTTDGATIYDVKRAAAAAQTTANSAASTANAAMPKAGGQFTGPVSMAENQTLTVNTPSADGHAATKKYVDEAKSGAEKTAKDYTDTREAAILGTENGANFDGTVKGAYENAASAASAAKDADDNAKTRVAKSGDVMGGYLTLHADPTNKLHAATKQYVDTAKSGAEKTAKDYTDAREVAILGGYTGTVKDVADAASAAATTANAAMPKKGGKFTGNVTMDSGKTLTVNAPSADGHAATKLYVDTAKSGAETTAQGYVDAAKTAILGANDDGSNYVGTVKGAYAEASAASTAASKAQGTADAAMPKAGGTFTGNVGFASGKYLTVHAPRSGDAGKNDAATRDYVDAAEISAVNTVKGLATDNENSVTIVGAKKYTDVQINTVNSTINTLKKDIGNLTNIMNFLGTTDSDVKQDATITKIIVGDSEVTVTNGDVVIKGAKEFVFDGSKWQEIGDVSAQSTAITNLQNTVGTKPSTPTMDNTLWEEVADLRSDLGESGATAGTGSAFARIKTLETWKGSHATEYTNLEKRVDDLETFESDHTTKYNSLKSTVDNHTTAIGATGDAASANGSLYARIKQNYNDINTASTGLKARVSALETWKGTHTTAYTNLSNAVSANSKAIDALTLLLTWGTF